MQQRNEAEALNAIAQMRQGRAVALDTRLALAAASLSLHERLATADSIVLATARAEGAILWTQDADLEGKAGVRFVAVRR